MNSGFFDIPDDIDTEYEEALRKAAKEAGVTDEKKNILFDPENLTDRVELPKIGRVLLDSTETPSAGLNPPAIELLRDSTQADLEAHISSLEGGEETSSTSPSPSSLLYQPTGLFDSNDYQYEQREVIVDKNGLPRQAGADSQEGEFIKRFRERCEQSLFVFLRGVLGRFFLTDHFHRDICNFIQQCPPYRKLVLMPREHAKTAIVSGGLPVHILIQPAATNIYFPGMEGSECRLLMAGETEKMAKKNLRVVKAIFDENKTFRAFWPHRCWEGKSKQSSKEWSTESVIIPRENEWPDPTIRAVGVGGAITGARPNVLIKDDLISFKAMNSEVVMEEAIEWHRVSRALLDTYEVESGLQSLEFIVGTRWAVYDLYSDILDNDPSVEVNDGHFHRIISDGDILWPEKYNDAKIAELQMEYGSMFFLLYLNSASDPSLTDFDLDLVRSFKIVGGKLLFDGDSRDLFLQKRMARLAGGKEVAVETPKRGEALDLAVMERMVNAGIGVRLRG